MAILTRAHQELFHRSADEAFPSLAALAAHGRAQQQNSEDRWHRPRELLPSSDMTLCASGDGVELMLNNWSLSQLCGLCKDTLKQLSEASIPVLNEFSRENEKCSSTCSESITPGNGHIRVSVAGAVGDEFPIGSPHSRFAYRQSLWY